MFFLYILLNLIMKKFLSYFCFLLILTCAKEDSQAPNIPPTQIVKQYTLTASAGDGMDLSLLRQLINSV